MDKEVNKSQVQTVLLALVLGMASWQCETSGDSPVRPPSTSQTPSEQDDGLSGPAIRPIAVRMVYEVHRGVDIPIIGIGGISCLRDALEFFLAGASAVQVGTANFNDPNTAVRLIDDLHAYCEEKGIVPADLVGRVETGR